jgi:glutamyl-tRNA(Gln) amidotransferase subunit E
MVENEVKRQLKLLEIRGKLLERKAEVEEEIYDLEEIFKETESKIIQKALKRMVRF